MCLFSFILGGIVTAGDLVLIFRHRNMALDKKQLKAQRRQARTDKAREVDGMKWTHDWTSDQQWNAGRTRMQNDNIRCKRCGMGFWNFRMKPMTCNDVAVHEIITNSAAPQQPGPVISNQQIGQVVGIPTGDLGRKE